MTSLEIFYNNGRGDVLPLVGVTGEDQRTLARQMSNCGLIYSVRLRDANEQTEDFRDGQSEHEVDHA